MNTEITIYEYENNNCVSIISDSMPSNGKPRKCLSLYSNNGKKIKDEFYCGNELQSYCEFEYDGDLLVHISFYKSNGQCEYYLEYKYNRHKQCIKSTKWSPNGGKMLKYIVYKYNNAGQLSSSIEYNATGDKIETWKYKYDSSFREIISIQIGHEELEEYTTETQYSRDGSHSYSTTYNVDGKVVMEGEDFYNEEGKIIQKTTTWMFD